jgi:hypothetical protein
MNPSKAVELMRIYLAEHRRDMTPDDQIALNNLLSIAGLFNLLMGALRAANMLVRGGDLIGCKIDESPEVTQLFSNKKVEN